MTSQTSLSDTARRFSIKAFSEELKFKKAGRPKAPRAKKSAVSADSPVLLLSPTTLTRFNVSIFSYTIGYAADKVSQLLRQSVFCSSYPVQEEDDKTGVSTDLEVPDCLEETKDKQNQFP